MIGPLFTMFRLSLFLSKYTPFTKYLSIFYSIEIKTFSLRLIVFSFPGRKFDEMNSARNNEEINSMKIVDETMGEVRRNWNVMTQDDVKLRKLNIYDLLYF